MTRERWQQIQELFYSAADLEPQHRREFLQRSCNGDAALQKHVEDLIASEQESGDFLEDTLQQTAEGMIGMQTGERLGAYRITGELGHGGMGDVYLAERDDDEFHMQVAIKVIRCGAARGPSLARFRAERQILASLEHPNIARLLDGGAAGGSPYLVMEYVQGEPIDEYCRKYSLSIRERLRLFLPVCEAIAYAHRNLIIHRDIKPSNILVNAAATPKLLDFGIAKLMKEDDGDSALTRPLERVMTPAYASPEIVRGERVTTAADVYSLGALLYELLTERAPFHLTSSQAAEVERVICKTEAPAAGSLDARLRGDLENIVAMAMHKEPERRYASVEMLMAEIDRYLRGYPVAARNHRLYRWGKFVKRHRAALGAGLIAVAGIAGWLVSLKAEQARTRVGFAQVRELAESMLFETDDALRPVAGTTAAREAIVKRGLRYLDGLARQSGADLTLQEELADAYERVADIQSQSSLGQFAGAMDSSRKALAIHRALASGDPRNAVLQRKLAVNYLHLSALQHRQNITDPAPAAESFRAAGMILDQLAQAAPGDPTVLLDLAGLHQQEARRQHLAGNFGQERVLLDKSQALTRRVLSQDPANREARRRIAQGDVMLVENLDSTTNFVTPRDRQTGLDAFQDAEAMLAPLAAESPHDTGLGMAMIALYTRGCGLTNLLDPEAQINACRKSTLLGDQLAVADPASMPARISAINAHHHLAERLAQRREEDSLIEIRRATELADQLFAERPEMAEIRFIDSMEHVTLAQDLARRGDFGSALVQARRAIAVREQLLQDATDTRPRLAQATTYALIAQIQMHQGKRRDALDAYRTAKQIYAPLHEAGKLDAHSERDREHVERMIAECERRM